MILFSSTFSSWQYSWILDIRVLCRTTFRIALFETLSNPIDGVVYFADKSQVKPLGIGSIHLKIPGISYYILNDVLYIPQFQRNLISVIQIRKQWHSIHIFDGIIEIHRTPDNEIVMAGVQEDKILKLKGTSSIVLKSHDNSTHLTQQSDTLSSSLLLHTCYGHIN